MENEEKSWNGAEKTKILLLKFNQTLADSIL